MPNGWKKTLLGNIMEFKNGLNFTKNDTGEDIKIVGVANFKDLNELHSTEDLEVVRVADKIRDEELLTNGDLLFVRSNGNKDLIGRCLYFPSVSERLSFSGFTIRGRAKQELVMPEYIAAVARSWFMKQQISKNGGGTNISNLSQQILNDIVLPLPKIDEQKRIIAVLSIWDKAIGMAEKLLSNSQQQKKALMQQLLTGKKRFSQFSGEWITYKFEELFTERVETGNANLPLLSITTNEGVVYQEDTGRKDTSNDDKSKYRRICKNDIGYNTMRMWQGRSSLSDKEGIVSPAYTIVIPNERVCPAFAAYLFKSHALIHVFYRHSQGLVSDTWNLKFSHFKKISWSIPKIEEQKVIASTLATSDLEIKLLQQKLNHLKQEKKALMQQLLTGKRRVNMEVA